jgi:hypothetical protein
MRGDAGGLPCRGRDAPAAAQQATQLAECTAHRSTDLRRLPYNHHLSPKVRAMVDFFVERFGEAPDWDVSVAA